MGNSETKPLDTYNPETKQFEKAKTYDDSPGVDLCFMLDCTGSMSSYIQMSRDKIKEIIQQVNEIYPKSEIRIAVIAYRDIGDSGQQDVFKFAPSADQAKKHLDKQSASGGGDTPEDVNGAFQNLVKLQWENPVRLVVHIADAPCHGKEYHDCDDTYPQGYKGDRNWSDLWKEFVELRLNYLFLKINHMTDKMFRKFKELAEKHGAAEFELTFQQEDANKSTSIATGDLSKAKPADHFAATITNAIKVGVDKEMKKGLQNRLNKRVEENAELMNKTKASVAETVKGLNFEEIRQKYAELAAKVGDCILSSDNFIDALADEDCLCLTFDIGRSQAAIVDPSQIVIKNVYPSFLTASSFFYSTELALKKNKLAHGGFQKHAEGMILKGAAQENITGVMPLYFCEENWKVAKQIMKPTIAWDVTLDHLGYQYAQLKTVPFLILAKLAEMVHEKPNIELLKFQFELVRQTCIQIMKDGSKEGFENKFDAEVFNLYSKYVEDTSIRTVDSIPNNSIFLAQLYIAKECGNNCPTKPENYFEDLFRILLEEELRRIQRKLPENFDTTDWIFKMLNVDVEKHVTEPVNAFINAQNKPEAGKEVSEFEKKFLLAVGAVKAEVVEEKKEEVKEESKIEETKTTDAPPTKAGDLRSTELKVYEVSFTKDGKYNEIHIKEREGYNKTLEMVMKYLYPLRMLFTDKEVEDPKNFACWGIKDDSQFFTLLIQNKLQEKNAARREAFVNKTYKNPWTQAEEFIQIWYNRLVEDEKSSRITRYLTSLQEAKSAKQANAFANSDNLNEAAGALMGAMIGVDVMDFYRSLCVGGAPNAKEKIKMLISGRYKGVKLYMDAADWTPCRRNANELVRNNKDLFNAKEWVELIPKLSLNYVSYLLK